MTKKKIKTPRGDAKPRPVRARIALTFAELEREMVAERIKDKMIAMVKQGRRPGGNLPFGYDLKDGKLVPNEREAEALRLMFETYVETRSLSSVRDKVMALGLRPKAMNFHNKGINRVNQWSLTRLAYILATASTSASCTTKTCASPTLTSL